MDFSGLYPVNRKNSDLQIQDGGQTMPGHVSDRYTQNDSAADRTGPVQMPMG